MSNYVDELKKIHEYLISNGWIDLGYDYGEYISKDYKFKIKVSKNAYNSKIIIQSAILGIFNRWADSGKCKSFDSVDEAIKFLSGEYAVSALEEFLYILSTEFDIDTGKFEREETYDAIVKIVDIISDWFDSEESD